MARRFFSGKAPWFLALILSAGAFALGSGATHAPDVQASASPAPADTILTTQTIPTMVKNSEPAVVQIVATVPGSSNSYYASQGPSQDEGSGFFINGSGVLVTNDHVIHGASKIQVTIPGHSSTYTAKVIGADYNVDLALLKVNVPFKTPYLTFANSGNIQVGQFAVAIGNPLGLNQTVTLGIVSAEGRPITISNRQYVNLLQTDAAINPGNSGGPLLNVAGHVLGVNTATQTNAQGIGFAIPISEVVSALPYLEQGKTMPQSWIGISIASYAPGSAPGSGLPNLYGAYIAAVEVNSPAHKAGLKKGEIVTAFNGQPVQTSTDLLMDTLGTKPGTPVTLTVWDAGKTIQVHLTTGLKPQNLPLG